MKSKKSLLLAAAIAGLYVGANVAHAAIDVPVVAEDKEKESCKGKEGCKGKKKGHEKDKDKDKEKDKDKDKEKESE